MTEGNELDDYRALKEAEAFVLDIERILKINAGTYGVLERYSHYVPVMDILEQISMSNRMLEIHLQKYYTIIKRINASMTPEEKRDDINNEQRIT